MAPVKNDGIFVPVGHFVDDLLKKKSETKNPSVHRQRQKEERERERERERKKNAPKFHKKKFNKFQKKNKTERKKGEVPEERFERSKTQQSETG